MRQNSFLLKKGGHLLFIAAMCLLIVPLQAQQKGFDTAAFYRHLVKENLVPEQIAFNKQMLKVYKSNIAISDSLHLNLAIAFNKRRLIDSAQRNMAMISAVPRFSAATGNNYMAMLIVTGQYNKAAIINTGTYMGRNDASEAVKMLNRQPTLLDTNHTMYSEPMYAIKSEYEKMPSRSGLMAGIYSAIIPGLGKWYLGYRQQAFSAFVENLFLGGMAAESYFKAGLASPRFIISGGLFALFYGGNIWGSAILAKKQKRDHFNQVNYEILEHYNSVVGKQAM